MNGTHNFRTDTALTRYSPQRALWDSPLFESDSFVALPTVGAFVEGWLLVVPRAYVLSYGQMSNGLWSEAEQFLAEVAGHVESQYGPVALFEHGPGRKESPIGCGVDYAHFHIVPTQNDLLACAQLIAPKLAWKPYPSISSVKYFRDVEPGYWALSQKAVSANCWIGTISDAVPPNQLFRRALALSLGLDALAFDWRNHLEAVRKVGNSILYMDTNRACFLRMNNGR